VVGVAVPHMAAGKACVSGHQLQAQICQWAEGKEHQPHIVLFMSVFVFATDLFGLSVYYAC